MKLAEFRMLAVGYDKVWEEVFKNLREYFNDTWEINEKLDYGFKLPDITSINWEMECIRNYIIFKLGIPEVLGDRVFYITRNHESAYHNKLKTTVDLIISKPEDVLRYILRSEEVFNNYPQIREYITGEADWFENLKKLKNTIFPINILE